MTAAGTGSDAGPLEVVLGEEPHAYAVSDWPGSALLRNDDVAGVAIAGNDRVVTFSRSDCPIAVFEPDGTLVKHLGSGVFTNPHGVTVSAGMYWCTDDGDHSVRLMDDDGTVHRTLGTPGEPAPFMSGTPFRRCTQAVAALEGEVFVSDGYGNACIHRFDADGRLISTFGRPGTEAGEFNLPHGLVLQEEHLFVADRENHRIQVFDLDGRPQAIWQNLHRPTSLAPIPGVGWAVAELGPMYPFSRGAPNLGPRVTIMSADGAILSRLQLEPAAGLGRGQMVAPHDVAVDSHGDIYVAQVVAAGWASMFPGQQLPATRPSLIKLVRCGS